MARTKAVLGDGARLTDFLGASLMARVVPPEVINEVLDAHGRNSRRIRAFPAVAGVYYVMALNLYPEAAYEAGFSAVSQGLAWDAGAPQPAAVGKASISSLAIVTVKALSCSGRLRVSVNTRSSICQFRVL